MSGSARPAPRAGARPLERLLAAGLRGRLLACLGCAVVYFVVLEAFLAVPAFNGATQIRPASGLGPILGLCLGWPGVVGSALGNLASDALYDSNVALLLLYFAVQLAYDGLPRLVWRRCFPRDRVPELSSAPRIMAYLAIALADSALVTLLLVPLEPDSMAALNIHVVRFLNNFLCLVYVGIPVMLALGRTLRPRGVPRGLAQRAASVMLVAAACASLVLLVALVAPEAGEDLSQGRFDELVALVYLALSALTVCLVTAASVLLAVIDRSLARPLDALSRSALEFPARFEELGPERVAEGALDVDLGTSRPIAEIDGVVSASNDMRRRLAASALDSRRALRERERLSAELDVAATIQCSSLPHEFSSLEASYAVALDAVMRPAREVGGDFYDCFALDADRVCLLVADVSDKGMPAALFMMRAMTELRECVRSAASLGEALTFANSRLSQQNDSALFVTAFVVALDAVTGELEYANAGHNLPWLATSDEGSWLRAPAGLPLGALEDFEYDSQRISLFPGEGIVLYTDGVTEARSPAGELFGDERLGQLLAGLSDASAACPCALVDEAVRSFAASAEQADDVTVCALRWMPGVRSERLAATPSELPCAQELVRSVVPDLTTELALSLDLIVEELFVNIVSYAYPPGAAAAAEGEKPAVLVECAHDAQRGIVHIVLIDSGVAYDPTARETAPVSGDGLDLEPGGLGVLLAREQSDGMWYRREHGLNVLHVIKRVGL